MQQVWKDIQGYEGLYQIGDLGEVLSTPRKGTLGGIKKPYKTQKGYLTIGLSKEHKYKTFRVHRLVACAFIREPLPGEEVNHVNGDKALNVPSNLEWVSHKENMRHAVEVLDKLPRGEDSIKATITNDTVLTIVEMLKNPSITMATISHELGVTQRVISDIYTGRSWRHVTGITHNPFRRVTGALNHNTVLKEEEVRQIKGMLQSGGYTHKAISQMYSVDRSTITSINNGKFWKHI